MRRLPLADGAGVAVTDRSGGVSTGRYATLNLGDHVGDTADAVAANRRRLLAELGPTVRSLVWMEQVHGGRAVRVDAATDRPVSGADALVTAVPGLGLAVLVADCVPVALAASDGAVVAVAHAGRRGVAAGILAATVDAVRGLGGRRLRAALGPAVCGRCYAVGDDVQREVAAVVPAAAGRTRTGAPGLDLRLAVHRQLADCDVPVVAELTDCTIEHDGYFSYRRDGVTGRFALVAWREPG